MKHFNEFCVINMQKRIDLKNKRCKYNMISKDLKKNIPKIAKLQQKRPLGNFVTSCYEKFSL